MWKAKKEHKKPNNGKSISKEIASVKGEIETDQAQILFAKFLYANPYLAIKLLTGVEIAEFQELIVRTFMQKDYCLNVMGRATSKCIKYSNTQKVIEENKGFIGLKDLIPSLDFSKGEKWQNIEPIKLWNGKEYQDITKVLIQPQKTFCKIQTNLGYSIDAALTHKMKFLNIENSEIVWKTLEEIKGKENKYKICVSRNNCFWGNEGEYKTREAYLVGLILGDGCTTQEGISYTSVDKELIDFVMSFGDFTKTLDKRTQKTYNINLKSKFSKQLRKKYELKYDLSYSKIIPEPILKSRVLTKHCLRGLFDTDGYVCKKTNNIGYCTVSKKMAKQIHNLLLVFGIVSKLRKKKTPSKFGKSYHIEITGKNTKIFQDNIGFNLTRKKEILNQHINNINKSKKKQHTNLDLVFGAKDFFQKRVKSKIRLIGDLSKKWRNNIRRKNNSKEISYLKLRDYINFAEEAEIDDSLYENLIEIQRENFYFDSFEIEESYKANCIDFNIPNGEMYWCNGFINHNSFTISFFLPFYAIFHPGLKVVVTARNARQTRAIFRQIEKWKESKEGRHLNDCIYKTSKSTDGWSIQFKNGSEIIFLPLGTGDQIRGMRSHLLIVDEFLLMDEGVFNNVIRPFMAAKREGIEQEKIKKAEDILIKAGKMKENERTPEKNNKLIILSSASYKFEYLYEVYSNYYDRLFPENKNEEPSNNHAIYKMSYEAIKHTPILDFNAIEEGRKTMSPQQFQREFESIFLDDSGGYFSAKKMQEATVPAGSYPAVKIKGDKDKEYILAIDPNYSDSETADNFAMAVLELDPEKDQAYLVHCYALAKSNIINRAKYVNYILNNFNVTYIIADNAGGKSFFNDIGALGSLDKPVHDFEADFSDQDTTRETKGRYNTTTRHILHLQQFGGKRNWIRESNEYLQYCIENKKVMFAAPIFNESDRSAAMNYKIPIEDLHFANDEGDYKGVSDCNRMKQSDFIDYQGWLVENTKRECSLVEMRSSASGNQVFDLPINLSKDKSPTRARKDSYTVLLLGCWAWKCYKELNSAQKITGRRAIRPTFIV